MEVGEDFLCRGVLYRHILGFFVLVDREVVAVFNDLAFGHKEGFCGPGIVLLVILVGADALIRPRDDVGIVPYDKAPSGLTEFHH